MLACEVLAVEVALAFVGRQHHHDVGPFRGVGGVHDFEAGGFGFGDAGRAGLRSADGEFLLTPLSFRLVRVGVALAAVADDRRPSWP